MGGGRSKRSHDRTQTDDSLRTERQNIDRIFSEKQAAIEGEADHIIERARALADAVLLRARHKADQQLDHLGADRDARATLRQERVIEDETLRDERADADRGLRRERLHNARALMALLPLERDNTDRYLLTERVRADDALSNRDNFLGIVSHDLRDLLGAMVTTAGLLSKRAPDTADGAQTRLGAERIQRYAARMHRLIGDLVDVASIDAGKLAISPVRGDVAVLIAEAVDTFQAAASVKDLSLEMELTGRPLPAEFDYERMLQVLANIITNAIKFTPADGSIRVRGERLQEFVRLSVTDTGAGIPPDMLQAVFERFQQVGGNDRRGLGLGLYIARCLVEAHGGTVWAESVLGEGTSIRLTLPLMEERRGAQLPLDRKVKGLRSKRRNAKSRTTKS